MSDKNLVDELRMSELIEELDRIIPENDASIVFRQYGSGPDESAIYGNRFGLLRAGVALLNAGVRPLDDLKEPRDLNALKRITAQDSHYFFDYFAEQDLSPADEVNDQDARTARLIGGALLLMSIIIISFAVYGVFRLLE